MKSNFNIITTTGFGATGSSAISHIISEFDNVKSYGSIEFWLLQDLHGISDLEYFLNEGNHRSKTFVAIRNFEKLVKKKNKFYSKYFPNFEEIASEYISQLKTVSFKKALHPFEYEQSFLLRNFVKIYFKLQSIKHHIFSPNDELILKLPSNEKHHFTQEIGHFHNLTKSFTDKLFKSIIFDKKYNHLMIDQLVPASNISRYYNYVNNLKVIVVDRDPRDIFLLNKLRWKGTPVLCETDDLDVFINWYSSIRYNSSLGDNTEVLRINFEDLVYQYEETLEKLINFCNLDKSAHKLKGSFFSPEASKVNTKLWENYNKYKSEISIIEKRLNKYCYKY